MDHTAYYATLEQQTVAQILLRYLQLEGIDTIFSVPGSALMHVLVELKNQRDTFNLIVCRQETGAAYLADGYARVTGRLGVAMSSAGPGATNALTGTMNAHNSHSALLTITGEVPEAYFGMGYFQEGVDADLDVNAVYRNAVRYSAVISTANNFQTLFTQALRTALSLPRRAAHISLPDDVAASTIAQIQFPHTPQNYRATPQGADAHQVEQALHLLLQAERPLIFVGNGCRQVLRSTRLAMFEAFVEKLSIPVMTTADAKAVFPESHALSLRNYGLANCEWPQYYMCPQLVDPALPPHYDALLVLGSTLGEMATNKWDPMLIPDGPFMQVDVDQSVIGRAFPVALGMVAELGAVIDMLCDLGHQTPPAEPAGQDRRAFIERIKTTYSPYADPAKRLSNASPILPQALMKCINDALPQGSHIFIDAGNCAGWGLHYLELDPPTQFHGALSMAPMGFGVAAVVGAKIGAPDRTCLSIVGDAAFMMQGNEVSTAAQHGVGAIWVVLNDQNLLMVNQGMNAFFPDPIWKNYYQIGHTDLAKFAAAMGAKAYNVTSPEDMRQVLPRAIHHAKRYKKPQVIVAHINTDEVPPYFYVPPSKP